MSGRSTARVSPRATASPSPDPDWDRRSPRTDPGEEASLAERLKALQEREGRSQLSPTDIDEDGSSPYNDGEDPALVGDEEPRPLSPPKVLHKDEIPQECQGHVGTLFQYLHAKNMNEAPCPSVRIPDTVILSEGGRISNWYFTSVDGRIKRKNRVNLLVDNVYKAFTKKRGPRDIVAQYIANSYNDKMYPTATVDYFDSEELYNFLHQKSRGEGILQKFIDPKGSSNCVLKATWTPRLFMLEQRINIHRLNDYKLDHLERCVTYEGSEAHSTANARVSATTNANLQAQCNIIAKHLYRNKDTCLALKLLVLFFKVDKDNRLYLLWCPQMKISQDQYPRGFTEPKFGDGKGGVPDVPILTVPVKGKSQSLKDSQKLQQTSRAITYKCPSCTRIVSDTEQYEVSYKTVIVSYNQSRSAAGVNVVSRPGTSAHAVREPEVEETRTYTTPDENDDPDADAESDIPDNVSDDMAIVPPTLARLNAGLTVAKYGRAIRDPDFLYKIARVCESCCLVFNECAMTDMAEEAKRLRAQTAAKKVARPPRAAQVSRAPKSHVTTKSNTSRQRESSFRPKPKGRAVNPAVRREAAQRNQQERSRRSRRDKSTSGHLDTDRDQDVHPEVQQVKSSLDLVESFDAESHHKFVTRQLDRVHGKMGANQGRDSLSAYPSAASTPVEGNRHDGVSQAELDSAILGEMTGLERMVFMEAMNGVSS